MKKSNDDLQTSLMRLIDEYAESRHVCSLANYNIKTFEKREHLNKIIGELSKSPDASILAFLKGSLIQMSDEIKYNKQVLDKLIQKS